MIDEYDIVRGQWVRRDDVEKKYKKLLEISDRMYELLGITAAYSPIWLHEEKVNPTLKEYVKLRIEE